MMRQWFFKTTHFAEVSLSLSSSYSYLTYKTSLSHERAKSSSSCFKLTEVFWLKNGLKELVKGLEGLKGWPEQVKLMQENWIGKSQGAFIDFSLKTDSMVTNRPLLYQNSKCVIMLCYKLPNSMLQVTK